MTLLGEKLTEGVDPNNLAPGVIYEHGTHHARTIDGLGYEKRFVSVGDISTPEDRKRVNDYLDALDLILKNKPEWPIPGDGETNPAYEAFYEAHKTGTTMQYWRDNHMPQAPALYILQRPYDRRLFPDGVIDEYGEDIFINAIDSIAIRARGAIYNTIIMNHIAGSSQQNFQALALGAGAGVPNIDATVDAKQKYGKTIRWKEYDLSQTSVDLNVQFFKEAGVPEEDVDARRGDLKRAYVLEDDSIDMVDMLGLWEYLDKDRCVEALTQLYRILKPGGVMVVSNMLEDRPQLDLNQRAIGWKGVKPRSIDDLIEIAHEAHLDTQDIRITLSDDGVYAVMEIKKP